MDRTTEYAKLVVSGKRLVGKTEYLCCKRHLDDMANKDFPYVFDVKEAEKHIDIANELVIGEGTGPEKLHTRGFQNFIIGNIFGWRKKRSKERRFREAYVQIARQNGKSFLCGVLANDYATFSDYKYGKVFCTATKQDQANIVWDEVKKFIESDPELAELYKVTEYTHTITSYVTRSEIKAIGRDTKSVDGFRSNLAVVDEYHAHPTNQMYKLMLDGQIRVDNALTIVITTAGFNLNSPCYKLYKFCKQILNKEVKKDSHFVYIAEMDLPDKERFPEEYEKEIGNPLNWAKSNPLNFWKDDTTLDEAMIARTAEKYVSAQTMRGSELVNFLTKTANTWVTASESSYLMLDAWNAGACELTLEDFKGKECYIGLDLSSGGDLTSCAFVFPMEDKRSFIHSHSFLPKFRLEEHESKDRAPYRQWVNDGLITLTDGEGTYGIKTDYKFVASYIKNTIKTYELKIKGVGYDPWNASAFLPDMENATQCDLIEVSQTVANLNEPTEDFRLDVEAGKVLYNEKNEMLTWSFVNAKLIILPDGKLKINKTSEAHGRIDVCDAVIDAWKIYFRADGDATNEDVYNAWREAVNRNRGSKQ